MKLKKLLILSLGFALSLDAFAQQRVAKNDIKPLIVEIKKGIAIGNEGSVPTASNFAPQTAESVVINRYQDLEDAETMMTYYDLQSNRWCSNRMYQLPNGNVGVVGTMSHEANLACSDRGTGYNFYNGDWMEEPEARVEPYRAGWPTIAQYGETGEVMVSHAPIHCYVREVAGEGEWIDMGLLPASPEGYPYDHELSWPRIATSGENHNIIHLIACIQHAISSDEIALHQVYYRSEDGGQTWITAYSPLVQDNEETGHYDAESYNISAYGHTVAMVYGDDVHSHVVMYKSTNDGQTWNRTVIWENPYYGLDFETDPASVFTDTVFGPANLALAVGPDGIAHVAMTTYEYLHDELGNNYTSFHGRAVDGVYYWNDTQPAPIQSPDGNPHYALRLWWPAGDGHFQMHNDSTKWIGYVPMYTDMDGNIIEYDSDMFYIGDDYLKKMHSGQSAMPALSIDPMGNIACAFSAPCTKQSDENAHYHRHIYVSYRNVNNGYWEQVVDELTDPDVDSNYTGSENIFTFSVDNTANVNEFWFGYQTDDQIGLYWSSNASQTSASENGIRVVKVNHDTSNSVYEITATSSPTNGGTISGTGTYTSGSTCTLHATPNNGYSFVKWTKNGTQVSTNANYSFTVTRDASFVAHFQQDTPNYTITATANPTNGGTITGAGTYPSGSTCTLRAMANEGFTFVKWTRNGSLVSTNQNYSFIVTTNASYLAHFTQSANQYTVSATAIPANGGSVSGGGTYEQGSICTLKATANNGFSFMNWIENGIVVSTEASYSFTVDRERSLMAVFSQELYYTISAIAGANGSISPEGDVMVFPGEDKTFTMIPNSGCRVSNVLVDGLDVGPVESYTFRNVNGNHSIRVQFSGLGVDDNISEKLKVYPNPANDKVYIESSNMKRIAVFDILGIQLVNEEANDEHTMISLDRFSQGTFILRVEYCDGSIGYSRFVVSK